jgi:oxygen-independent coproporphyrinogen-3 oxidase
MPETAGAYLHVPFCQSRCSYCHFTTRPWQASVADRYARAVAREIEQAPDWEGRTTALATVYFGGGTPSLVPPEQIHSIVRALRTRFGVAAGAEISLEANPGTLSEEKIAAYATMGVNRVSLGAQSFKDTLLRFLGRTHTADETAASVRTLRTLGLANINLDLMLGLPGQDSLAWREDIENAVSLGVPHLSVYMLDLDASSPLQHAVSRGLYHVPGDDLVSDLYLETLDRLQGAGYRHYEISNFAFPGSECQHNLRYWRQEPVLGFGVSSHSDDGAARYANTESLRDYLDAVEHGRSPVAWRVPKDDPGRLQEAMFLGLRLSEGIDWDTLARRFGQQLTAVARDAALPLIECGLLEEQGTKARLSRRGILLSNEVFQHFV